MSEKKWRVEQIIREGRKVDLYVLISPSGFPWLLPGKGAADHFCNTLNAMQDRIDKLVDDSAAPAKESDVYRYVANDEYGRYAVYRGDDFIWTCGDAETMHKLTDILNAQAARIERLKVALDAALDTSKQRQLTDAVGLLTSDIVTFKQQRDRLITTTQALIGALLVIQGNNLDGYIATIGGALEDVQAAIDKCEEKG